MIFLIYSICYFPFIFLLYNLFFDTPADPFEYVMEYSGFFIFFLFCLTILTFFIKKYLDLNLIKYRKIFGLSSFFYAFVHLFFFIWLELEFDFYELYSIFLKKKYIIFGFLAFLIILFMATTSTKKLFKSHKQNHEKMIIPFIVLAFIHTYLSQKAISYLFLLGSFLLLCVICLRIVKIFINIR